MNGWLKMRKGFGITNICLVFLFGVLLLNSEAGIQGNPRIVAMVWFMIWCGILGTFFSKKKWATIATIVFYSISILFNLLCVIEAFGHFFIVIMDIVFMALLCISLNKNNS